MKERIIGTEILNEIQNLKNDFQNGSTAIAVKALKILVHADQLMDDINLVRELLSNAKPAMAAPRNILNYAKGIITRSGSGDVSHIVETILEDMKVSKKILLRNSVDKIFSAGDIKEIITCSYSATLIDFLTLAKQLGFGFKVLALKSEWKGYSYGENICNRCRSIGIDCEVVADKDMAAVIDMGSIIISGADSIIKSGGIVNGIPTPELAEINNLQIPFYVLAESFKVCDEIHTEDGFGFIPQKFISFVFSDNMFL